MAYTASTLLIKEGEGEVTDSMVVKVRAQQLSGDFSVMEGAIEKDQLLAPHTHTNEDQCIFVIDGEVEFEVGGEGGERFTAGKGSYVIKPRGIPHAFWNKKATTCRYIELSGGRGFEQFTDSTRYGAVQASMKSEEKFGVKFHSDQIPRLMKQHGLTSIRGLKSPLEELKPPFLKG
ncbi:MAG: cupin domain-containing protein [Polyangiaceae bacterium]